MSHNLQKRLHVNSEDVLPPQTDDVGQLFDSSHNRLTEIIDKHVPLKQVSKRPQIKMKSKPYFISANNLNLQKNGFTLHLQIV